jgi:hypothetical protein
MEIQEVELEPEEKEIEEEQKEEEEAMEIFANRCREIDEMYEIECGKQNDNFKMEEYLKEQFKEEWKENRERKKEITNKLKEIMKENKLKLEEIKEISQVMNGGEQCIVDGEEQLGVDQMVPINTHQTKEAKREKKVRKRYQKRRQKKELYTAIRLFYKEPYMPNKKIEEFLKKPPDIDPGINEEGRKLLKLLKEKNQRELMKKPPDKPWKSKTLCKKVADIFYEKFITRGEEENTRRGLSAEKKSSVNTQSGSHWSGKKILNALVMIQSLAMRRRDLEGNDLSSMLTGEDRGEATTGAVSFSPARGS